METQTNIKKWGNSFAVRLPKTTVNLLSLKENCPVSVSYNQKQIIIKPVKPKLFSLAELTKKITKKNSHTEIEWGQPAGGEIW